MPTSLPSFLHDLEAVAGIGQIVALDDLAAVVNLIIGEDQDEPAIVASSETRTAILFGSHQPGARADLEKLGWTVNVATSRAAGLRLLSTLRVDHVASFNEYVSMRALSDPPITAFEAVHRSVHTFTPECLTALYSIAFAPLPGSTFAVVVPKPEAQIDAEQAMGWMLEELNELTLAAWLVLVTDIGDSVDIDLSGELRRHVIVDSVPQSAIDRVLQAITALTAVDEIGRLPRYILLALGAHVATASQTLDPNGARWALAWLEHELIEESGSVQGAATFPPRVDAAMAIASVDHGHLLGAINVLGARSLETLAELPRVLERVGALELNAEYFAAIRVPQPEGWGTDAVIRTWVRLTPDVGLELALFMAKTMLRSAPESVAGRLIRALCNASYERFGHSFSNQATIEAWAGAALKDLGMAQEFLDDVGDRTRTWESELDFDLRFSLWAERSNALRLVHRLPEAAAILSELLVELDGRNTELSDEQRFLARRNHAIIIRDQGQHERALEILRTLVDECARPFLPEALRSLIVSYAELGRFKDARAVAERAWEFARHSALHRGTARMQLAVARAAVGDSNGAAELLGSATDEELRQHSTLISYCSTALTLEFNYSFDVTSFARGWELFDQMLLARPDQPLANLVKGHVLELDALRKMLHSASIGEQEAAWEYVNEWSRSVRGYFSPEALIGLAAIRLLNGDNDAVRTLLDGVATALGARYEFTQRVGVVASSTGHLSAVLRRLTQAAGLQPADDELQRVIAELSRDAIGRSLMATNGSNALPWDQTIRSVDGAMLVLEWQVLEGDILLVATVKRGDSIQTVSAEMPASLRATAEKLGRRLEFWGAQLPGDPFDFEEWRDLHQSLNRICDDLSIDDNFVAIVVEHEALLDIPWHVLIGARCRTVYAPSWSEALDARSSRPLRVSSFVVGRVSESVAVAQAMEAAIHGFGTLGSRPPISGSAATLAGMSQMLESSDLALILCHGVMDVQEETMAWLVSNGEGLPARSAGSRYREDNLFRSSDCERLLAAPGTVLSAACSTGRSRHEGVGEYLGLYGSLRRSGTHAFVSPRWNVPAGPMVEILTAIATRIVAGISAADAVRQACVDAEAVHPKWIAWALTTQGSWK